MRIHSLSTRVTASILFVGHSLMSCSGLVATEPHRLKEEVISPPYHELPASIGRVNQQEAFVAREVVGKKFEPQLGQEVTFYKERGVLKAQTLASSGLEVYIGEINPVQKVRARHIHIVPSEQAKNKRGYVYIDRGGLAGGMMESEGDDNNNRQRGVPPECFCPITKKMMEDPVIALDGYTYERTAILKWFAMGKDTSPQTGAKLPGTELISNESVRTLVASLKASHPTLATHKMDISSIEAAIKLREEEIQQDLELRGNLLEQEQAKLAKLESELVDMRQRAASLSLATSSGSPEIVAKDWSKEEVDQLMIQASENDLQALNQLIGLAQGNNSYAQFKLGKLYDNGRGVAKDAQKAVEWYQKAADQEDAAQYYLGWMYYNGQGVAKDAQKAVDWYQKAADQGDANAQFALGVMYANGQGVAKDAQKAVYWYQKAADQGFANAQFALGVMHDYGQGVAKDAQKAVDWYQKAADQGLAAAQKALEKLKGRL